MNEIRYTTPSEQIQKLRSQNMIVIDEEYAEEQLFQCGYSNLIKSYRDPYIFISNGKKMYRSGVTFEQLQSLYTLDKNLRNAVMGAMLDLEEHIKEAAADVIASSFGVRQDEYLQFRNYRDKSKKKYCFSLAGIIETMKKALKTDKNPIAHYSSSHGIVPPWILFKSIYFSTIVNFIHQFKPAEQTKMVKHLYDPNSKIPKSVLPELMMDTLFVCLEYRNLAAHGGRIYNYECEKKLRFYQNPDSSLHGFNLLLLLLSFFKYKAPLEILEKALNNELNRHCNAFPEDVTYLGQILNVDITVRNTVWITNNSQKYHRYKHCSGILNAKGIDIKEADSQGYTPCKKCYK